jgi:hypothetical protein
MDTTPSKMRAWRLHKYGQPLDVMKLEFVDIPEPGTGELRVKVLGIPFYLNDLERVTGGNMMVKPEFPLFVVYFGGRVNTPSRHILSHALLVQDLPPSRNSVNPSKVRDK